jgi:hypothetical protein
MDIITAGLVSFLVFVFMLGATHRSEKDDGMGKYFAMIFMPGVLFVPIGLLLWGIKPQNLAILFCILLTPLSYMGGYYLTDILMGGRALSSKFGSHPTRAPTGHAPSRRKSPNRYVVVKRAPRYRLEITPDMKLRLVRDP